MLIVASSRKVHVRTHLQNIPTPYIPINPGDQPKKVQWLIFTELLRSARLRMMNKPASSAERGWGLPGGSFDRVHFRKAVIATASLLERRLSESSYPPKARLKNQSMRSYIYQFADPMTEKRHIADIYLDIYEEIRFTNKEVMESQYKDFLSLFAILNDTIVPNCKSYGATRESVESDSFKMLP